MGEQARPMLTDTVRQRRRPGKREGSGPFRANAGRPTHQRIDEAGRAGASMSEVGEHVPLAAPLDPPAAGRIMANRWVASRACFVQT